MINMPNKLTKVMFQLPSGSVHGYQTETVWAEHVGDNRYRIRNSPFYAYDVSAEDIVFTKRATDSELLFAGVSLRGCHSTYRIICLEGRTTAAFKTAWASLEQIGCSFEEGPPGLLAIDVPSRTSIYEVYALLEKGAGLGLWDFEEGHCGHPLSDNV